MVTKDQIAEARRDLGQRLADAREAAGWSQSDLARKITYSRSTIASAETGAGKASRNFWTMCDQELGCRGALLVAYGKLQQSIDVHRNQIERERIQQRRTDSGSDPREALKQSHPAIPAPSLGPPLDGYRGRGVAGEVAAVPAVLPHSDAYGALDASVCAQDSIDVSPEGILGDAAEIASRRQRISSSKVDQTRVDYLETTVVDIISQYERRPPAELARLLRATRRYVESMIRECRDPRQLRQLYVIASRLSGILGVAAVDSGRNDLGQAYGAEAFHLVEVIDEPDAQAWARAAQSLIAYYSGDYRGAVAYAQDGQRGSPSGAQAIRLAVNGEARALARLGDGYGVDRAVDRAFNLLSKMPDRDGVSTSLDLRPYCPTRAAANAATAYLALGETQKVREHLDQALVVFDRAGLCGPQALSRFDLAAAALLAPEPDIEEACSLAKQAMDVAYADGFESVCKRAEEFIQVAHLWAANSSVREIIEHIQRGSRHPQISPVVSSSS